MKPKMNWFFAAVMALALSALFVAPFKLTTAHAQPAQDDGPFSRRTPHCTNGTASGTYAYRMSGSIINVGTFLVNGLFTHNPDGTMSGKVHLTIGDQQLPNTTWEGGKFTTNDNCTGSGEFFVPALQLKITYNFIASDGGKQIELLNTNPGIVLQGYGRRIAEAGRAPHCNNGLVIGTYGIRLDGAVPGLAPVALAGTFTHSLDGAFKGVSTGSDLFAAAGQFLPRANQGTFSVNSDCTGTGFYTDSLGNNINYVFVVLEGGKEIFFQGSDPGVKVSGVGKRL
jgi:hypothetical protein